MLENDKLADALHAMSSGDADDSHDGDAIEPAPESLAPAPPVPAAAKAVTPRAEPQPSAAPAPRPSRPPAPTPRPAAKPTPAPTAPVAARPSRPSGPSRPATTSVKTSRSAVPTAPIDYAAAPARKPMKVGTLNFRRTLIPPCLVVGVSLLLATALWYLQSPDSALRQSSPLVPIGMAVIGVAVLAAGVFNMLLVRAQMTAAPTAPPP